MNIKIQELPGTGKTFIANTIRNIDIILNPMFSYTYCAPTECSASLINESTYHQSFNIPTGRRVFHNSPKDWKEKNGFSIIV